MLKLKTPSSHPYSGIWAASSIVLEDIFFSNWDIDADKNQAITVVIGYSLGYFDYILSVVLLLSEISNINWSLYSCYCGQIGGAGTS